MPNGVHSPDVCVDGHYLCALSWQLASPDPPLLAASWAMRRLATLKHGSQWAVRALLPVPKAHLEVQLCVTPPRTLGLSVSAQAHVS
jgi:hypothetical protein